MYLDTKLQYFIVKSENHVINASFVKCQSIVSGLTVSLFLRQSLCYRTLVFDLNLMLPDISLSTDDTYYLCMSTSVAHTTILL